MKHIRNYIKYDIFFDFCFTENIFPSIIENPENMIFTLSIFSKMLFFMQCITHSLTKLLQHLLIKIVER